MTARARPYRLSPRAETDLEDIWRYTARTWSAAQADRYAGEILDVIEDVAAGRRKGRSADIGAGYLKIAVGAHVIYYRARDQRIDVIRILHQRMDIGRHL